MEVGSAIGLQKETSAMLLFQSTGHQCVNKRPICSLFAITVLFGKLLCSRIIPGEMQCTSRSEIFCLTKEVTRDSIFSLIPCPLNPLLPLLPLSLTTIHASLSHLCLHASSSQRCTPELLNDTGISRGWQRLLSFKPFNFPGQCESLI